MLRTIGINEDKNIKVHGRTVKGADPLPLFWNHSGIEVNCDGSELWIDLEVNNGFHEPWIAIEINGALIQRRMLLKEDSQVCLFRSMTPGVVKNVRFYRETQAMSEEDNCQVLVKGLRTDGNLLPVEDGALKLEFIGDSITSGEGTYGALPDTDWLCMYMSSSHTYAVLLEKMLKADVRVISQGGWGIYIGWDNDPRHNIPSVYEPICGLAWGQKNKELGALGQSDYKEWAPDAIVVNLGTNDTTSFNMPPLDVPGIGTVKMNRDADGNFNPEQLKLITDAHFEFLKMLRRLNPTSHILWAYGMLGSELAPFLKETIERYKAEEHDDNVAFLELPDMREDTVGAHSHPGFKGHIEASKVLADYLSNKFGVEKYEIRGNY